MTIVEILVKLLSTVFRDFVDSHQTFHFHGLKLKHLFELYFCIAATGSYTFC